MVGGRALQTRVTKLLGIEHPILQGGMAWVSDAVLAAAVSEAGGLGIIAGGAAPADIIRTEIRRARELTNKPFGLNVMLMSPYADELAKLAIEEKVAVITTGAGSPGKHIKNWKDAGIKVIPVVPSVALALRMERMGADAVIAEGTESGGHIGETTTIALVPQVVDAVAIPVIAAGGIADGRGMAAALCLGAEAVQCGTCFLVATECCIHQSYKAKVLKAGDTDTIVTGRSVGRPVRSLRTPFSRQFADLERGGATADELEVVAAGSLKCAVKEGDMSTGTFMAGQAAGLVKKEDTCKGIIMGFVAGAKLALKNASIRIGNGLGDDWCDDGQ